MPEATRGRETRIRWLLAGMAAAVAMLGLAILASVPVATGAWPYTLEVLSYQFLAAVVLALAASLAWVAWSGELSALAGIGLTVAVSFGLMAVVLLTLVGGESRLLVNLLLIAGVAALGVGGFQFGARRKPHDQRVTPAWARAFLGVLAVTLLLTGIAMLLRTPDIMPWAIDRASMQLIGALFVGDAAFFLYAVARPAWPNAAAAWLAFVVYDIVIVAPLLQHFSAVQDQQRLSLTVHVAVVLATLLVGLFALFVNRSTRIVGPEAARREMRL